MSDSGRPTANMVIVLIVIMRFYASTSSKFSIQTYSYFYLGH